MSFADNLVIVHDTLLDLDEFIDGQPITRHLSGIHAKAEGHVAYAPLMMFKALLLQSWCALSDPALVEAISPRPFVSAFCWLKSIQSSAHAGQRIFFAQNAESFQQVADGLYDNAIMSVFFIPCADLTGNIAKPAVLFCVARWDPVSGLGS